MSDYPPGIWQCQNHGWFGSGQCPFCRDRNTSGHKLGCLLAGHPDKIHRVPIDCVTLGDLQRAIDSLREDVKVLGAENVTLKAKLYDYEHDGDNERFHADGSSDHRCEIPGRS